MEILDRERAACCALNRIFGYEPVIAHRLIETLGSASALFDCSPRTRKELLGPYSKYLDQITPRSVEDAARELDTLAHQGCRFLCLMDGEYPERLAACEDAPVGLYIRSESDPRTLFRERSAIAVVGTRDLSLYGRDWCRRIVEAMGRASLPPTLVSGFAIGTDIVAHATALEMGLPTIAVLPTGIDDVYPRRHRPWASRLEKTEGCALVTDYPPGTAPLRINFLRRNRIIAGLCSATILIESKQRGGGLITADFAFNYDRDVYALPGRPDDVRSQGCNLLIKRHTAEPILDPDSLVGELGLGKAARRPADGLREQVRALYEGTMDPGQVDLLVAVADCIRRRRGITREEIAARMGCSRVQVAEATGLLEADGIIESDLLQGLGIRTKVR